MTWTPEQRPYNRRSGFALIVVLASLLVLTTLFAIASQRSLAHLQTHSADQVLALRQAKDAEILTMLLKLTDEQFQGLDTALPASLGRNLAVQDVGGLIDLNTARPQVLGWLFDALKFPPGANEKFRQWRKQGQRLTRVDDLIRITNADPEVLPNLTKIATVFSGRHGIAIEVASAEVQELIAAQATVLPNELITAQSGVNFAIYDGGRLIGTINRSASVEYGRVLELR